MMPVRRVIPLTANTPRTPSGKRFHSEKYGAFAILEASDRRAWRAWLRGHYKTAKEIWLIYYKKGSGKTRIEYNDAVEEALCFGWIDSQVRTMDAARYAQRFSPRNPMTPYSQANQARLRRLATEGKLTREVRAAVAGGLGETFNVPADILAAVRANPDAWQHYRRLPKDYIRIRAGFIDGARNRPAEFRKRLAYFVRMTAKGKMFGHGGIDKYYWEAKGGPSARLPVSSTRRKHGKGN
jgi:uncharacterized protein YdeI (YjbR/CyaY-like superfamily)